MKPALREAARALAMRIEQRQQGNAYPSKKYVDDPIAFAGEVLGVDLWTFQREFLEAIRDNRHIAVAGGRKIGKSLAVAIAALWWVCTRRDARVVLLAPKIQLIEEVVYHEVKKLIDGAKTPLGLTYAQSAQVGVRADDGRQIFAMSAINEGGLRGISGVILAIVDEAADVPDVFHDALVGNLAGAGCRRVLISNPVKTQGQFYRAFHEERHLFRTLQVSSEQSPNIVAGRNLYPGLASREWLEERKIGWGIGSVKWTTDVLGQFIKAEAGALFTIDQVGEAERRWSTTEGEGRLHIGVDVAGETIDGDETAFAVRRGMRCLELYAVRGVGPEGILEHVRGLLRKWRLNTDYGDDAPRVVLDSDGREGARVMNTLRAYRQSSDAAANEFFLVGFRGGIPPKGLQAQAYRYQRDQAHGALVDWIREGGAIPTDLKLEGELLALRWGDTSRGQSTLPQKSELRQRLGRSPDRCDALVLSCWADSPIYVPATAPTVDGPPQARGGALDPYVSRGGIDPYASGGNPYGGVR